MQIFLLQNGIFQLTKGFFSSTRRIFLSYKQEFFYSFFSLLVFAGMSSHPKKGSMSYTEIGLLIKHIKSVKF